MESVKTSQTITEPDERRLLYVIINQKSGSERRVSFADIETRVAGVVFPVETPDDVRNHLTTAKNLLLYSWYYYPFSDTATLQCSLAVECALRLRLKAKPRDTLSWLLKEAIRKNIIKETGFPRWSAHIAGMRKIHGSDVALSTPSLLEVLVEVFPSFRNTLAHGVTFFADSGFLSLNISADIIDQLFRNEKEPNQAPSTRMAHL